MRSDPATHLGSFFGNAIADWTGVLVTVIMTKHLYEKGSAESKNPKGKWKSPTLEFLREHSLTVFLVITWLGWVWLFRRMDTNSRWGQVVGNLVSEWTQILGLVWMTKILMEVGSKGGVALTRAPHPRTLQGSGERGRSCSVAASYGDRRIDAAIICDRTCRAGAGHFFLCRAHPYESFSRRQNRRCHDWHHHA